MRGSRGATEAGSYDSGMLTVKVLPWPWLLFSANGAAQQAHKLAGDRKAQAGAAIFAADRAIGLAEGLEHALLLFLRYADAGVGHAKRDLSIARPPDRQFDLAAAR